MDACFVGYIVQAIVNNFVPLLFLTFEKSYSISLSKITMLITFNFGIQLVIDLLSTLFFKVCGIHNWKDMALIWAVVPIINGIVFTRVPIASLIEDGESGMTIR